MLRSIVVFLVSLFSLSTIAQSDTIPRKRSFAGRMVNGLVGIVKEFNNIDTTYIEPQRYKFTTTLMSTYSFEQYKISSKSGQEISFSPEARFIVGPYFGWSLLFLGYTFDLGYISTSKERQINMSVYTSMLGVDFFWKQAGKDYKIRSWDNGVDEKINLEGVPFDGLSVSITGLNAYYIFNHRRFSYPAAFSQSTCQRKSAGSFMLGAGYTRHTLQLDHTKLQTALQKAIPDMTEKVDSGLMFDNIRYTDVSFSAGYGYNWVFSRNWLLSASLSAAIGFKHSAGDRMQDMLPFKDFSFNNINFDGVGRFGIIWNNSKWYFGSFAVVHSYNYNKPQFKTTNYFGNVYVYVGVNFGRKKNKK